VRDVRPLKTLASIVVSNVDKLIVDGQFPVRLVNYTDVYYGDRLSSQLDLMPATATAAQLDRFRLRNGDVLITKDSETADDIGVAAYVEDAADDMVCGYHLALLRPQPQRADGRFLYWAMRSDFIRDQFSTAATGVTRFGLRVDGIASTAVPAPAVAEQRAIAAFLDTETARIDALITKKRRLIELLDERFRTQIDQVIGQGPRIPLKRLVEYREGPGIMAHDFRDDGVPLVRVAGVAGPNVTLKGCNFLDPETVRSRWSHFALREGDRDQR